MEFIEEHVTFCCPNREEFYRDTGSWAGSVGEGPLLIVVVHNPKGRSKPYVVRTIAVAANQLRRLDGQGIEYISTPEGAVVSALQLYFARRGEMLRDRMNRKFKEAQKKPRA